ncbi:MAG: DUF4339 domain-containing protein [Pirellulales bacterium]|nr:DUF4339 domain-containing protein [Pirellulales bacterium]
MSDEWYYAVDGRQAGPVAEALLKQLIGSGQVRPQDLVWRDGMPQWQPAASVLGLLAAQAATVSAGPPSVPPSAGNPFDPGSAATAAYVMPRAAPGKVVAIKVMMIVGAAIALLWSLGLMASCIFLIWPGTYLALVTGIWGLVAGLKADRERPPKAIAILQICLILNFDVTNLALGIVELVFLGDPEVATHYDAASQLPIMQ